MQSKHTLDELAKRISGLLPGNLQALHSDLEDQIRALLQQGLQKMNLVTREEFDIQVAVLARTREKLAALEQLLAEKK